MEWQLASPTRAGTMVREVSHLEGKIGGGTHSQGCTRVGWAPESKCLPIFCILGALLMSS